MTTLPIGPPAPTVPSVGAPADAGEGVDFLALLTQLVGGGAATDPVPASPSSPAPLPGAATASPTAGGATADPAAGSPLPDDAKDDEAATDPSAVAAPDPALLTPPLLLRQAVAPPAATADGATAAPAPTAPSGTDAVAPAATRAGDDSTSDTGADPGRDGSPAESRVVTVPPAVGPITDPGPITASPATAGITGTTAPATAVLAQPAPTPTEQVTRQVFPEVVETVTAHASATGPSRVTVRLQPEALGEVRVVLSTHGGELRVSLAATGDAHRALLEGTPELRRLLESVGSPDARVVVRDLPGTQPTTPTTSSGWTDVPTDLAGGTGPDTGRSGEQTPDRPPHGRPIATDGTHGATNPSHRPESVTRARSTGLDVTM